jgi:hypothetical protein
MKLKRLVEIQPAFDKRHSDPNKNYGIHGAEIKFLVKGKKGVIQFVIFTNWHLPHVQKELEGKCHLDKYCFLKPLPADVGYHSFVPMYDEQKPITDSCPYLDGKPCYYDGSGLWAEDVFKLMVREGHEAMWKELEKTYHDRFDKVKANALMAGERQDEN